MNRFIVICGGVLLACAATAQTRFPAEVERFIERQDQCDHFRGEEPYDQERRAFLHQRLREFCVGIDKELAELKQRYRSNKAVMEKLNRYEPQIES
jgi:hypothetical protein